jgi:bcr-type benzoyl-CoA reductase subunit C
MSQLTGPLAQLAAVARDPRAYIQHWREAHPGRPVLAVLPMNFPRELALAADVLPVIVQDDRVPVTEGRALLPEFYCGYTRNLADQAATGRFDIYDAVLMADHCIQLIGAADVVRQLMPDTPLFFGALNPSLHDSWADRRVNGMLAEFRDQLKAMAGAAPTADALRAAIRANNRDRALIRRLFDERTEGRSLFSPVQLQDIVASAMVMVPEEHLPLLEAAVAEAETTPRDGRVRVHLSGHLCHAPRRELLEAIEDSGAQVVDDDLYHGRRHVSTDVLETGDPFEALGRWYFERNNSIPCPTRVQRDADWDVWLVDSVRRSGAEAVIHLIPKFCEPHMLYFPELRKGLDAVGIPQLQIETEHEGMPLEAFRTRIEALVERALRKRPVPV